MKKLFYLILFFLTVDGAYAHRGGHGPSADHEQVAKNSRVWRSVENQTLGEGTFLLYKNNNVFIESSSQVFTIPLSNLHWIDQQYVNRRVAKIKQLNGIQPVLKAADTNLPNESEGTSSILLASILFGSLIVAAFCFRHLLGTRWKLAACVPALFYMVFLVSCSSDDAVTTADEEDDATDIDGGDITIVTGTSDPEAIDLAFDPFKSKIATRWDNDYFYVESNGIPDHQMMVGITAWIAQFPTPHDYTGESAWAIPLNTEYADDPVSITDELRRGAIAVATNGIPIFNPINASGLVSNEIGELDAFGGHSGRGDDYHYHTAPLHLENESGSLPVAYAFDGYAVYGSKEPDGSDMESLDEFNGHEDADGNFHYHGTSTYPYIFEKMKGVVTLEGSSPETQIEPQPVAMAFRADPHPINSDDLIITDLVAAESGMGYTLFYTSGGTAGSVEYSWNENDLYTFIFNDVDGSTSTETFQR